jgi:hypothetical protein
MLSLTLAAAVIAAPVPPPRSRPVYDYATLTAEEAQALAGRTIRVRANIVDPDEEYAENANDDDNLRGVVWRRGEATLDEGELIVEGRLAVRYVPGRTINGEWVEASTGSGLRRPARSATARTTDGP